ncbi:MAG: hypothetical protein IKB31_08275 [Bacteroidaceae bacterium]|nr:hypothetical protein [Bacteroidaceae bacterium]
MKKNLALRMIMAIAVMFGVQTTASAQLRGLLKKAKKALNVEITVGSENESEEAANNTTTESNVQPEAADQQGGTLQLKPETFIYQPVDDPVNAPLYDINNPKVKEYYDKWIELGNLPNDDQHYWLFEFFDYQSPTRGLKQVHVTEYPLVAYFSYFITHPNDVEGYRCYIRARLAYEILALSSNVHTVPYKLTRLGWTEEYTGMSDMRKLLLNDGTQINLLESEKARLKRWKTIDGDDAYGAFMDNTSYEVIRSAMQQTMNEAKQAQTEGRIADAFNLLFKQYRLMKSDIERERFTSNRKNDDIYLDMDDDYKLMYQQYYQDWLNVVQTSGSTPVDMPKEAAVSAEIKNQATAQAKAKFGASFVKAIVVESDWHVYTDPNNFNRTDHRSMDVDVIVKEGDEYFVSHQMLWQNYQGGSWGSYDMRQKSQFKQKVNYK